MSRTIRKHRKTRRPLRDGARQYSSAGCEHGGNCDWCRGNRTHSGRRRAPDQEAG